MAIQNIQTGRIVISGVQVEVNLEQTAPLGHCHS
jgi:hypothetical protein